MSELEKELTDMQGGWYGWDNVRLEFLESLKRTLRTP